MQPAKIANNKYIVPMSLWFVEQNQRLKNGGAWSWPCPLRMPCFPLSYSPCPGSFSDLVFVERRRGGSGAAPG